MDGQQPAHDRAVADSLTIGLGVALLAPATVVGLAAAGLPATMAIPVVVAVGIEAIWIAIRGGRFHGVRHRLGAPVLVGFLITLGIATYWHARLGVFMLDATRSDLSVLPARKFFREHTCLSAYTEAVQFALAGRNIYEFEGYVDVPKPGEYRDRYIGPLTVDVYQYPPTFLVLPLPAMAADLDFFTIRRAWFFLQSTLLCAALIGLARWISGRPGITALFLMPLVWIAPTTRLTLQVGNFQSTVFAFDRNRHLIGGAALAFTARQQDLSGRARSAARWRAAVEGCRVGAAVEHRADSTRVDDARKPALC
jgi:hypothetical protein